MNTVTMAVAGKGGTGKTTICALIARELVRRGLTPILAVDADPNTNLAESLGATPEASIGGVLADFLANRMSMPQGVTKESYLQLKIEQALEETKDIDFLVMGRKAGSGCYCVPNTILKNYLQKLLPNYRYAIIDNEAGMEHLSRKNMEKIDVMVFVSDHSAKGLRAARRINELVDELKLETGKRLLIVNRYREHDAKTLRPMVDAVGARAVYTVPEDSEITRADAVQKSFLELPEDLPAVRAIARFLEDTLGLPAVAVAR